MTLLKFAAYPEGHEFGPDDLSGAFLASRDMMPWPCQISFADGVVTCQRLVEGSASLRLRWTVPGIGQVVLSTTPLMERDEPYHLQIELAREKLRQLRERMADWEAQGLAIAPEIRSLAEGANNAFLKTLSHQESGAEAARHADRALHDALLAAERLVIDYSVELLRRKQNALIGTPPVLLGCRLPNLHDQPELQKPFQDAFGYATIDVSWARTEPQEGQYQWGPVDRDIQWCHANHMLPQAGPLVQFRADDLPDWLAAWDGDFGHLESFVCDYVETTVARYRDRVQVWNVVGAANSASVLNLSEDELLRLAASAIGTARRVQPKAICIATIADPWGDYLAEGGRSTSPIQFAETLVRGNVGLTAIGLELFQGLDVGGGYCRDLSQMWDLLARYSELGVPLHISSVAVPGGVGPDADSTFGTDLDPAAGGTWHRPWDAELQAEWLEAFLLIAASIPYMHAISYSDFTNSQPHRFPHAGLLDADGRPAPAYEAIKRFRNEHLATT